MRFAAVIMLALAARAGAWSPYPETSPTNWVELVEAVRERCEATRYGKTITTNGIVVTTNLHYLVQPANYAQPIRIPMGVVATNYLDPVAMSYGDYVLIGPVICETNITATSTNIWCWTNHVALDTDYYTLNKSNELYMPFGPQVATNLIWDLREEDWEDLYGVPPAWTAQPSAALINQLDTDLKAVATQYVDTVAIDNAGGIEAWFSTPSGTNWFWVDTDNNETNDAWVSLPSYPASFPGYTLSNLWRYAGLEPYRYLDSITTQTVTRYGWEVGQLDTYSVERLEVATNWFESYAFTAAPTVTPWKVSLGQLWLIMTNTVATYATNGNPVNPAITNGRLLQVVDYIGAVPAGGQVVPESLVPRMLAGPSQVMTNTLLLVPPGTGTLWQGVVPSDWSVEISGKALGTTGVWKIEDAEETHTAGSMSWSWASNTTIAAKHTDRAWISASLSSTGLSFTETYVYSNGVLVSSPTVSLAGTSVELVGEGASFEVGPAGNLWQPTAADYAERLAIATNLKWLANLPADQSGEYAQQRYGWPVLPFQTNCYEGFCEGTEFGDECKVALPSLPWTYNLTNIAFTGSGSLSWTFDHRGVYREEKRTGDNCDRTYREAYFEPTAWWPETITYRLTNLTDRLAGAVDCYARLEGGESKKVVSYSRLVGFQWTPWGDGEPIYHYWDRLETVQPHLAPVGYTTNTVTFATDAIGAEQLWPRLLGSTTVTSNGHHNLTVDPTGKRPDESFYAVRTLSDSWTEGNDSVSLTETYQVPNKTERTMRQPSWLYRYSFKHLSNP